MPAGLSIDYLLENVTDKELDRISFFKSLVESLPVRIEPVDLTQGNGQPQIQTTLLLGKIFSRPYDRDIKTKWGKGVEIISKFVGLTVVKYKEVEYWVTNYRIKD